MNCFQVLLSIQLAPLRHGQKGQEQGHAGDNDAAGRGLHSFASQLNLSAFHGM